MALESDLDAKLLDDDERLNLPQVEKQEDEQDDLFAEMAWSSVINMTLKTTIELGVFDIIVKVGEGAKLSAKDIVDQIETNNPEAATMLDRVLRLLASHSLLCCCVVEDPKNVNLHQRLYSLSPCSKCFVTDADASLGPSVVLSLDKVFYQIWSELKRAILEGGIPFNMAHGMQIFDYTKIDARFNKIFSKAMHNLSTIVMKRILDVYKGFEHINKLVDVGGDMFESVSNGDAILMKHIIHDWDDEECLKILKNCHKAIPNDGKVIVVDNILPNVPEPTAIAKNTFKFDVVMMTQMSRGKERTKQDFMDLAKGSGFTSIKFVCCLSCIWVMEFYK
ncbi:hypothetical protein PIB30_048247 [Stylosanthes scabra]|uniref:Uncharacterized protein n=1 Tax=Stylosanthes scabra TaxID=79078 RepID=A0ABU6XI81_9FABA|nr:hypothetical protein [Stylosanthes scabra]